jgi:tetratricopeptide (TPR) repeat protein
MPDSPPGRSILGTFALVAVAIMGLFAVDMFLARLEQTETRAEAARRFREGQALMQRGENAAAIGKIKDAIAAERGNRDYKRSLAQAELAAGKTEDAESTLTDLLQSDSTDGLANLTMGRVMEKEGRIQDAITYLRRAAYGHWNEDEPGNRLRARFELIDVLARRNSREELLSELLLVEEKAPHDVKTQAWLGHLFLEAASPARAAEVFRGILHDAPANADAHEGLAEAEFARGNYHAADREFQIALRLAPGDQITEQHLALCNQLLALDPTVRGIDAAERFHRSLKLLDLALSETRKCIGPNQPADLHVLIDGADAALKDRVSAIRRSDAAESNLDLAERLWQARRKECQPPPDTDSPLALVLARLAQ